LMAYHQRALGLRRQLTSAEEIAREHEELDLVLHAVDELPRPVEIERQEIPPRPEGQLRNHARHSGFRSDHVTRDLLVRVEPGIEGDQAVTEDSVDAESQLQLPARNRPVSVERQGDVDRSTRRQ